MTKKATKEVESVAVAETPEVLTTFKGFTKELKCIDFQYEIGKSYTQPGKSAVCCEPGSFHSVEMPLDTFTYYGPATSRYAETEISGPLSRKGDDTKVASLQIAIKAELKLPDLIRRAVEWVLKAAKSNTASARKECAAATGDSGHAAATGYYGHAAATGNSGHAAATGDSGHAAATGDSGHAAATGNSGHAAATGNSGHAAATGDSGHAAATGDSGHAAATGNYGHAAATGNSGHAAATGYYGHAAATGDSGHAAATGNYGHAAATGNSGHAAATGNYGTAFAGFNGIAKAGAAGSFAIAWVDEAKKRARLIVGTPGEDGIKADTFYRVENGKLAEVV